ncbi:MAG: methyltransferase type 11 [Calditrichaeota bacterium]|nr:MAG: methyltransferase type 11 [Calditrichota bacterium]
MQQNLKPNRPKIITTEIEGLVFNRRMNIAHAIEALLSKEFVLVDDFYSTGLQILEELNFYLKQKFSKKDYNSQREARSVFRELSHKLLLMVSDNRLEVRKSPKIGWLKILYPEISEFFISFPDVQGLNSSWQWFQNGIKLDILPFRLKPYFGTYFPTRFDHLELFENWLKTYNGTKKNAIDIGVGSGVLSFQMLQNGFQNIYGTDSNPNSIIGLTQEVERLKFGNKFNLSCGDLFASLDFATELIVFNPPWLIANHELEEGIDKAIYYEPDLFPRFFEQAKNHLAKDGKIVMIFSNFAKVVGQEVKNPINVELGNFNRFRRVEFFQKKPKPSSKKTRRKDWRQNEKVELWVLSHK